MVIFKTLLGAGYGSIIELLTYDEMFAYFISIVNDNSQPDKNNKITYPFGN
jgi:hypothetical protein